jgi:phosphate transport system permease protein
VLVIIVGIVYYLVSKSGDAWRFQGLKMLTSFKWAPRGLPPSFGFLGWLIGSVIIAVVALVVALPISIATALAINEYAPRGLRRWLTSLVDLLAALPSIVFGLWGLFILDPHLLATTHWIAKYLGFIPIFRTSGGTLGHSLFEAGLVVAIMIIPIITSISREVMSQTPRDQCEAALALGGTRWGMITDVIFPFSRSGIIGGAMLGLGRALGETIAVSIILSSRDTFSAHILEPGARSISQVIVSEIQGSSNLEQSALVVAGLTLFLVTLAVNLSARAITSRGARV